jgi:hypothetical protein
MEQCLRGDIRTVTDWPRFMAAKHSTQLAATGAALAIMMQSQDAVST